MQMSQSAFQRFLAKHHVWRLIGINPAHTGLISIHIIHNEWQDIIGCGQRKVTSPNCQAPLLDLTSTLQILTNSFTPRYPKKIRLLELYETFLGRQSFATKFHSSHFVLYNGLGRGGVQKNSKENQERHLELPLVMEKSSSHALELVGEFVL